MNSYKIKKSGKKSSLNTGKTSKEDQASTCTTNELNEKALEADVSFTDLQIAIYPAEQRIIGICILDVHLHNKDLKNRFLLFSLNSGLSVTSVKEVSTGLDLPFEKDEISLRVFLSSLKSIKVKLKIFYEGTPTNPSSWGSKIITINPDCSYASWLAAWYPSLWQDNNKSTGQILFTVPSGYEVVSSGRLQGTKREKDVTHFLYQIRSPMNFAFVMSHVFFHLEHEIEGLTIGVYFLTGGAKKAELYINQLTAILQFLKKEIYGMYPYDSYKLVEIPKDIIGNVAFGEQGMNLFSDTALHDYFNLPLISHEIGHSWWGNWVVGDRAFLSEGLAQLTSSLCVEHFLGSETLSQVLTWGDPTYFQSAVIYFALFADQPKLDIELGSTSWEFPSKSFLVHTTKGHVVLFMLRELIGKTAFYQGLRSAIAKYAHQRMTLEELTHEWEQASGIDLKGFINQWFYRSGAPELELDYSITSLADKQAYQVQGLVRQLTAPYDLTLEVILQNENCSLRKQLTVRDEKSPFSFIIDFFPSQVILDPDHKILRWSEEFRNLKSFGEGFQAVLQSKYELGEEIFSAALEAHPKHWLTAFHLGKVQFKYLKTYNKALKSFFGCLNLMNPPDVPSGATLYLPSIYLYLGHIYDLQKNRSQALAMYQKAKQCDVANRLLHTIERYEKMPYKDKFL